MYLVDTNIWLERLLDQDRSEEVGDFLQRISNDRLYLTDFTLHSIGIILLKLGEARRSPVFVRDALIDGVACKNAIRYLMPFHDSSNSAVHQAAAGAR